MKLRFRLRSRGRLLFLILSIASHAGEALLEVVVEGVCKGRQSTLRRGWFWGAQAFEERLRGKVREEGSKPEGRALRMSAESKACHDEEAADLLVLDGMKWLHLKESELKTTVVSDPRKVAIYTSVNFAEVSFDGKR